VAKDGIDVVCSGQSVSVCRRRRISRRDSDLLSTHSQVRGARWIWISTAEFENSVVETYIDFLSNSSCIPISGANQPVTFSNGSIATLETGLTGIPLTPAAVEPGGVSFTGQDYHMPTPITQGFNLTVQYALTSKDTVQVAFVGNTVHHLGSYVNPNSPREMLPPGLNVTNYIRI